MQRTLYTGLPCGKESRIFAKNRTALEYFFLLIIGAMSNEEWTFKRKVNGITKNRVGARKIKLCFIGTQIG